MSKLLTSVLTLALAGALVSGCASVKNLFTDTPEVKNPYGDAFRVYEEPCVIPLAEHSPTLDVMLINTMKDRGLKPQLVDEHDEERIKACRITVHFSVEGLDNIAIGVKGMSLFYRDHKTGETYWVGMGKQSRFNMPELVSSGLENHDPQVMMRQLVERLYPERIIRE